MIKPRTIRTAVIGLGRISWSDHLPRIAANPDFELAAVVDPSPERCRETARKYGAVPGFASIEEMLPAVRPDLTVIASPTHFHMAHAIMALEKGSHVFCDKPVALNLSEAREMFAAARHYRKKLTVYQPRRFYPDVATAREIIESGKLGRIFQIKLFISNFVRRNDWQAMTCKGGGMLNNYGAHYIDQMLFLLREPLKLLCCRLERILSLGNADDVVKLLLSAESGILLDIDINQAAALPGPVWRIYGDRGAAESGFNHWKLRYVSSVNLPPLQLFDDMAAPDRMYPSEQLDWQEELIATLSVPDAAETYYKHLADYLNNNAPPPVRENETLELMQLIEQAHENAHTYSPPYRNDFSEKT